MPPAIHVRYTGQHDYGDDVVADGDPLDMDVYVLIQKICVVEKIYSASDPWGFLLQNPSSATPRGNEAGVK